MSEETLYTCPKCGKYEIYKHEAGEDMMICMDCEFSADRSKFYINNEFDIGDHDGVVVACVQNKTTVDQVVWRAMKFYAKKNNLKIILIPIFYSNTQRMTPEQNGEEIHFEPRLMQYMFNGVMTLGDWEIRGDIKIRVTTPNPLNTIHPLSRGNNMIAPSTQRHLVSIPTIGEKDAKIAMSTGALTKPNVSETSLGSRAKFNHFTGFTVVHESSEKGTYLARQIPVSGGRFYDLGICYDPKKNKIDKRPVKGYKMGDLHFATLHNGKINATLTGKRSFARTVGIVELVLDDVFDGESCDNHLKSPFEKLGLYQANKLDISEEIRRTFKFAYGIRQLDYIEKVSQAYSNHDTRVRRWMEAVDWREDQVNAEFYLSSALDMVQNQKYQTNFGVKGVDPLKNWVLKHWPEYWIDYLDPGHQIGNYVVGMHGDVGSNGSRGSLNQFAKMSFKCIVGHTHSPGINCGAIQVGQSVGYSASYTSYLGSWSFMDAIISADGNAQMVHYVPVGTDGKLDWGYDYIAKWL